MRVFGTRAATEVAKPADVAGESREFVRRQNDFHGGSDPANNPASLLQRMAGTPEQEVDKLIAELQSLRQRLQSEGARVERRIVDYATLNQSAMQSAKVIAECLHDSMLMRRSHSASASVSPRLDRAEPSVTAGTLIDGDRDAAKLDGGTETRSDQSHETC